MADQLDFFAETYKNIPEEKLFEICFGNTDKTFDEILEMLETENSRRSTKIPIEIPIFDENEERFTRRCDIVNCSQKNCYRFHNIKQRRRPLSLFNYTSKPCFSVLDMELVWGSPALCYKGDSCVYAHTENELTYYVNPMMPKVCTLNTKMKLPEPGENPRQYNIKDNALLDKSLNVLKQKTEKVRKEISDKTSDILIKKSQIRFLCEKIQQVRKNFLCSRCFAKEYAFIVSPCGHVFCEECKGADEDSCPKCWSESKYFKINF